MPKLYTYFRSSAAYRVRIALELKGLSYDSVPVHLLRHGGEQHDAEYQRLNPQELVPTWVEPGLVLSQSLAIMEYLEESYPERPALLPKTAPARARVRSLALSIACDIHPLNNLRVLQYLNRNLQISTAEKEAWIAHWITQGFAALETQLAQQAATGAYCHGDTPGWADCVLIPQVFNAQRVACNLEPYPTIMAINQRCLQLAAFTRAAPDQQSDFEA